MDPPPLLGVENVKNRENSEKILGPPIFTHFGPLAWLTLPNSTKRTLLLSKFVNIFYFEGALGP